MNKHIAIIAPLIDTSEFNLDFTLRLNPGGRDLSLLALYETIRDGYNPAVSEMGNLHSEEIPSAGYYLQGLLHQHNYPSTLTAGYDRETIASLGKNDLLAVVVSTTMIIAPESLNRLISDIHNELPGIPVIAGGVFLWKNYLQYTRHLKSPESYPMHSGLYFRPENSAFAPDVMVVSPHGAASLLMILERLQKQAARQDLPALLSDIPNLAFAGKAGFEFGPRTEEAVDYNSDFTRWNLVEQIGNRVPVRTSIGCPYRCGFCDFWQLYPRIFLRSAESLKQELTLVKQRLGTRQAVIHVSDDNVFITKKRIHEVCGAMEQSGIRNWVGFMRGGEYSEEETGIMVRSGLKLGMVGVESGDQGQLDRMNKKQKITEVKKGIEQLDAAGIAVLMTFVVGYPGETSGTVANTIGFMNGLKLANSIVNYQVYPLQIFGLSELAGPDIRAKYNIRGYNDSWSHNTMDSAEALKACHTLFRQVTNVPYHYPGESHFFNRGRFRPEQRNALFALRHRLTISLLDNEPPATRTGLLKQMAEIMGFDAAIVEVMPGELVYLPEQER